MRQHTALAGFALVLLLVAVWGTGAVSRRGPGQSANVPVSHTSGNNVVWTVVPVVQPVSTVSTVSTPVPSVRRGWTRPPLGAAQQQFGVTARRLNERAAEPKQPALASAFSAPEIPDRLLAPTIRVDVSVVPVGWQDTVQADGSVAPEWEVASHAAGWHKSSARLGEVGNTVIAGHSNIEGEVFRDLGNLQIGDPVFLFSRSKIFSYNVVEKFVLEDKDVPFEQRVANARWIGPFTDERLTLLTCWPPNNNTHRIFIIAKPMKDG